MANGTFTYNDLRTKALKERIKAQEKFKQDKSNAVSITAAVTPYLSMFSGLSWVRKVLW